MESNGSQAALSQESLLDSYCAEFQRLATTLVDLLDVAARRASDRPAEETGMLRALAPVLERLTAHVVRITADPASPIHPAHQASSLPVGVRDVVDLPIMSETSFEELCAPAVDASVAEVLGTGILSGADAMQAWLGGGRADAPAEDVVADDGPEPEPEAPEPPPPPELVPPERLLPVLMEEVGRPATLQGTSMSMPISSLFELLSGSRQSGCLHLRIETELIRIVMESGLIVATSTSHPPPGQRLGDMLVDTGALDRERVDQKAAEAKAAGRPLGAVLVEQELISLDQLKSALQAQVQSRFDRVFSAPHVAYAFVPDARKRVEGEIRANPRELLLESARRADEAARAKNKGS